ncbi:stemmadenine O-acetyltransferase [Ziziphus jujuba]|uniref:Stemmadenine O-acetyltransferase n=1 Tax=Ziziphus jujuba TaxID=326968 RepID=A0A6P4ACS4_ZIZJJ|nr:stemmadenine O-acetyltransferase [Ziziphus jujuba]
MAGEMEIEIIRRETIKPSTPTPHHLQSYKLCLLDQLGPVAYGPLVLFYPNNKAITTHQRSQHLKKSLSEALTLFYPLAGTVLSDNNSIQCIDDGAHFIEARVHGLLANFLHNPDSELLHRFLPIEIESTKAGNGPVFLVQASFFDCGGLAVGTCFAHKIGDATTLRAFLKSWSAIARGHGHEVVPHFGTASRFPPRDHFPFQRPSMLPVDKIKNVTKRFVFHASKMEALKAKVSSASVPNPTRVEAATALLWRSAMAAWRSSNKGIAKHSALTHAVNIRKWVQPPLPESTIGNLITFLAARTDNQVENQRDIKGLVAEMRKGKKKFTETQANRLGGESTFETMLEFMKELAEMMGKYDMNRLTCTSLCNFGLYGTDFGWGKPIWVTTPTPSSKNLAMIIDTRDGGGVDMWLCLTQEDMALFERDPELLEFASPNPSLLLPDEPPKWTAAL